MNHENFLKKQAGMYMDFEENLFNAANYFSDDYDGGHWEAQRDTEDGFVMLLDNKKQYTIKNSANFQQLHVDSPVDSKTFSLMIFAYIASSYGNKLYEHAQQLQKEDAVKADWLEDIAQDYFKLFYYAREHSEEILTEQGSKDFFLFID